MADRQPALFVGRRVVVFLDVPRLGPMCGMLWKLKDAGAYSVVL